MSICDEKNYNTIVTKKDGKVDLISVMNLLMQNGVPPVFARAIVNSLDKDGNGYADEAELRRSPLCSEKISHANCDQQLKAIFDSLDVDRSGYIDKEEMRKLSQKADGSMQNSLCKLLLNELTQMDTNHDNKVSLEEFIAAAKKVK